MAVTCPTTGQPCEDGCGRRRSCTPLGMVASVLTFTAPGVVLLIAALCWFAVAAHR